MCAPGCVCVKTDSLHRAVDMQILKQQWKCADSLELLAARTLDFVMLVNICDIY